MSLKHKPLAYGILPVRIRKIARDNKYLNEKEIWVIFNSILNELHAKVNKDMRRWIMRFVPKMTGALRRDLYMHIKETIVKNTIITFYIETSLVYARRVNSFATSNVRHRGKRITYKRRKYTLWDPEAIGHFFDKMVIYAIRNILFHLKNIKRRYAAKTKLKFREMKIIKLW